MRFLVLLSWFAALLAQPAAAQVTPELQQLERRLAVMAQENPGEYGIAAMDLATGSSVAVNGNQAFPMASTMKIAVAAAYLAEVDAGRRSLDDRVGNVTAGSLMDAMITRSDNRATDLLLATLGGPAAVDQWMRAHGLTGIRVDRTIAQLLSARRDLRDVRDSSTPTAMLDMLRLIDTGDALKPGSRLLLLDMMRRCRTGSNRIRGILPPGATVEHKTGTLSGYTGDVGFLTLPTGRRIAVAFFARYGENRPGVIATAARMIYDAFGTTPRQAPPAEAPTLHTAMAFPADVQGGTEAVIGEASQLAQSSGVPETR
ncbi:serine hydrolase [Sphingosinicella rhizophila]|uniref:Beta-lactamase n=1 Tax=Sphingosinicella rhizophila TaxID=3050082 RepID=A0ABU3QB83_9SPHN|nr:serine hydrolase [Sphingosinicella sp. GR2756]MDT9600638.1 serine hydrolase [Sphingosinicella sp. GR2756]